MVNIALPDQILAFVEEQAIAAGFSNVLSLRPKFDRSLRKSWPMTMA